MYDNLYKYLNENNLFLSNQSGFRKGDSCVNQLLVITHEIYQGFDCSTSVETRGVFLDMSKAFDKVWYEGILLKLKNYGVKGRLLNILNNYLHNRKQRVVLNGIESNWKEINAGVPQGSVLGPLLFLVYINDLSDGTNSIVRLFADDTSLFSRVLDINHSRSVLDHDLSVINYWANKCKMLFNPDVNKQAMEVVFSRKRNPPVHSLLTFNNCFINQVQSKNILV